MIGRGGGVGTTSAFVGRVAELEILASSATDAWAGDPRLVLVEGDAGLGKSALLRQAVADLGSCHLLRASGDEAEVQLSYGVIDQLVASADPAAREGLLLLGGATGSDLDPSAVGAELVRLVGDLQADDRPVVIVVDDLHWCDGPSAQALLFAFRRLRRDRVLVLVSGRPSELARLGGSWSSAVGGDHRSARLRLGGLTVAEVTDLADELGVVGLSGPAATRLHDHAGGSPLHCRALLEELDADALDDLGHDLPVPKAFASIVLLRVAGLSPTAHDLVTAAAVLGLRSPTALAAAVAGSSEPAGALDELAGAGLLAEEVRADRPQLVFAHALVRQAIYDDLSPSARRALHGGAGVLTEGTVGLRHRAAATLGPDEGLAAELERVGVEASARHALAEASTWWRRASELSADPAERARRLLRSFTAAVDSGDFALAASLSAEVEALDPSAFQLSALASHAFLNGQLVVTERLLLDAAARARPGLDDEHLMRVAMIMCVALFVTGRVEEAVSWGERGVAAGARDPRFAEHIRSFLALNLAGAGRIEEALEQFSGVADEPAEMSLPVTQRRVFRGITRLFADDLAGAVRDLTATRARYRAGQSFNYDTHGLTFLVDATFRAGAWDEAAVHADFAVSIARDADHVWDFGFVHAHAALVPAARGDWAAARAHLDEAWAWSDGLDLGFAVAMTVTARALMCSAQEDWEGVLAAVDQVRSRGRTDALGRPGVHGWRPLEVEAHLELGRLDDAERALEELQLAIPAAGHPTTELAAWRLRGVLEARRGSGAAADEAFAAARRVAPTAPTPLELARLDLADGRRLVDRGRLAAGRTSLESARQRLLRLGARPFVERCELLLRAAGAIPSAAAAGVVVGLTPTELVVARLVSDGGTNQEVAAELFVSVKAIEFHLTNIYAKLGIRSRRALAGALSGTSGGAGFGGA